MTEEQTEIFPPGTRVKHRGTGECGIVIHSWYDRDMDSMDYYIAFFGESFPDNKPEIIPYVLRYNECSLVKVV